MRQLTNNEKEALNKARDNHNLWIDSTACSSAFDNAFIAGLEYQDKRIEVLEAKVSTLILQLKQMYNDANEKVIILSSEQVIS